MKSKRRDRLQHRPAAVTAAGGEDVVKGATDHAKRDSTALLAGARTMLQTRPLLAVGVASGISFALGVLVGRHPARILFMLGAAYGAWRVTHAGARVAGESDAMESSAEVTRSEASTSHEPRVETIDAHAAS